MAAIHPAAAGVRVGVTGHRARPGLDWAWTARQIRDLLTHEAPVSRAFTSLASGSDQLFAREAFALHIPVTAVIPMPHYEKDFDPADLLAYRQLLARCDAQHLDPTGSDEEAYLAAGHRVADSCDLLVAVWDGQPAAGLGGTADIVAYCLQTGRRIIHLNPIAHTVQTMPRR